MNMISRDEAVELVRRNITTPNLIKHVFAVEAIMRELAKRLNEDEKLWGLVGLLHDLDYEKTKDKPEEHTKITVELLKDILPPDALHAIRAHNFEYTGITPETKMDNALIAADALSGFIIAAALVMPNKKLAEVRIKTLKKKFKDKTFARGTGRNRIRRCELLGLDLPTFFEIGLTALQGIADVLGL